MLKLCRKENIALVAIHPFGNPHHDPSKKIPHLLDHPSVVRIAKKIGVARHVVLVRALLQTHFRVVYTNTDNVKLREKEHFLLSQGQLNQLDRLKKLYASRPLNLIDVGRQQDPMWPFLIYNSNDAEEVKDHHGEEQGNA